MVVADDSTKLADAADETLVSAYQADRCQHSLDELLRRHLPRVRSMAFSMLLDDAVVAEITDDRTAWPWCEWEFEIAGQKSNQRAKLVWMGWRVAEAWDESPVPRYLLRALLERVGSNREQGM